MTCLIHAHVHIYQHEETFAGCLPLKSSCLVFFYLIKKNNPLVAPLIYCGLSVLSRLKKKEEEKSHLQPAGGVKNQ